MDQSYFDFSIFEKEEEFLIIKHISKFPSEIIEVTKTYNPSRIARFCYDLSSLFHKFYVNCKIKGQDEKILRFRISICFAVLNVLKSCFSILKIEAKEEV